VKKAGIENSASFDKLRTRKLSLCHKEFILILSLSKDALQVCSGLFDCNTFTR